MSPSLWIDRAAGALADTFESSRADRVSRGEWWMLGLLLLAGAAIRFWGLGAFGLHKPDEDTTVLAAAHILIDGHPQFPSGMYYARAIVQSYLIAGSAWLFGENEWALRLPSAVCGVLLIWICWQASRRFLDSTWRIALAATVAALPLAIADAQEARMYPFMVASLAATLVFVFRWERSERPIDLVWAVACMWVAVQFQELALLGALVVLYPGLRHGEIRRIASGVAALAAIGIGYLVITRWQGSFYPPGDPSYLPDYRDPLRSPPASSLPISTLSIALVAAGCIVWLVFLGVRRRLRMDTAFWSLSFAAALVLQAAHLWHAAALAALAGLVFFGRDGSRSRPALVVVVLVGAAMAVYQLVGAVEVVGDVKKALGQLTGRPSIWVYAQSVLFSPVAAAFLVAGLALAIVRLTQRRRVPEVWLLFVLAVWIPLLVVGVAAWFVPIRYIEFALVPFLLTAFVCARELLPRGLNVVCALLFTVLAVNPLAAWRAIGVNQGFPDHKAAAEFLKGRGLAADDVVIAEEVLLQRYYVGRMDYWLTSPEIAAPFVLRRDGAWVEQYVGARVLDSVEGLKRLRATSSGEIYIIGSREGGDRSGYRGETLNALLESSALPVLFEAPDGTKVWQVPRGLTF